MEFELVGGLELYLFCFVQILARHTSSQSAVLQLSCSSLPTLDCISALVTVLTDLASPNDLTLPCMGVLENLGG